MTDFFEIRDEQRRRCDGTYLTLYQRASDPQQYRHARFIVEMTGFDEPTWGYRRARVEAHKISGFDRQRPRVVGSSHRLIKPDLDRGLVALQFAELSSVNVGRRFCRHDGAGDLARSTGGVDRAVLPLDRRPVVASDARQLQATVILDLLDHCAEGVDVG